MLSLIKRQDWFLNAAVIFLAACSLLILSSIDTKLFWQQLIWFVIAFGIIFLFSAIDWSLLNNYKWLVLSIYLVSILLLLITYFVAPTIRHTRSWIVIGPVQIQTSEFAKLALIIIFSVFFAKQHIGIAHFSTLAKSFFYFALPAALVLIQPDMGSTIILFSIWFGFLLISGIRWKHLGIGFLILLVVAVLGWNFFLKDYQKGRILAFINPNYDPLGINYNVIQSKIAIGSGGFFGKGYKQGTQVQLGFLPAAPTDFVFSAFVEEWGIFGGILIIGALTFLLLRIIRIGLNCQNNFGKLICLGTAMMFLTQFVINIGSTLGLLPVVGITFPFFSYGGSSILTNAMLVGIIQSAVFRSSFLRHV